MKFFENDSDDKMKNLLIYGMPLTDKELSEAAPYVIISVLVIIVILFIIALFIV